MESLPWWILSVAWLVCSIAIWGAVLAYAYRHRLARPKAARLVFVALGVNGLQWLLSLSDLIIAAYWEDPFAFAGEGSDWANPYVIYHVSMQLIQAAGEITSWSLLTWAALVRPDETSRRSPV